MAQQHEQQAAAWGRVPQRQHDQRAGDQVAEADHVAAHRVGDDESGRARRAVESGAPPQQPLIAGQD